MPVESAQYVSQLVPSNPAVTDPISQGQQHFALIKTVLQATFPEASTPQTAPPATINLLPSLLPAGNTTTIALQAATTSLPGVSLSSSASGAALAIAPVLATSGATPAPINALTADPSGNVVALASLNSPSIQKNGVELVPSGVICMWAGPASAIPAGWLLCNGANGTPDLRDRFIVGAGLSYGVGAAGGVAVQNVTTQSAGSHNHTGQTAAGGGQSLSASCDIQGAHNHTGYAGGTAITIAQMPGHTHGYTIGYNYYAGPGGASNSATTSVNSSTAQTQSQGGGQTHNHSISTDGAHQHNITVSPVQNFTLGISTDGLHAHNLSFNNLPPYFALCYIMKA